MNQAITVTTTRNPNFVTFSLETAIIPPGTGMTFADLETAETYPLAHALFKIKGVKSIWILGNDIQITKDEKSRWGSIQSKIIETIRRTIDPN
jgi:hypothetical protein